MRQKSPNLHETKRPNDDGSGAQRLCRDWLYEWTFDLLDVATAGE